MLASGDRRISHESIQALHYTARLLLLLLLNGLRLRCLPINVLVEAGSRVFFEIINLIEGTDFAGVESECVLCGSNIAILITRGRSVCTRKH